MDNFQDGDHFGWSYSNTGGTGSSGVSLNGGVIGDPENLVAWASESGPGTTALTQDFEFNPTSTLLFDMQTRANRSSENRHSWSGVTVTFFDTLNFNLGEFSLYYGSNGSGNISDQNWHNYSATMSQLANLAGTNMNDPSKVSLSFWAQAQGRLHAGYSPPSSVVYFDNIELSAVPLPAAAWFFVSGLLGFLGISQRRCISIFNR